MGTDQETIIENYLDNILSQGIEGQTVIELTKLGAVYEHMTSAFEGISKKKITSPDRITDSDETLLIGMAQIQKLRYTSDLVTIKLYGSSDDLVEIECDQLSEEFNLYDGDKGYLVFIDVDSSVSYVFTVQYTEAGQWKYKLLGNPRDFVTYSHVEAVNDDNYSDIVTFSVTNLSHVAFLGTYHEVSNEQ